MCTLLIYGFRLESEISEVLGDKSFVGEEDLEKLQYTEQVKLLCKVKFRILQLYVCIYILFNNIM